MAKNNKTVALFYLAKASIVKINFYLNDKLHLKFHINKYMKHKDGALSIRVNEHGLTGFLCKFRHVYFENTSHPIRHYMHYCL